MASRELTRKIMVYQQTQNKEKHD